MTMPAQAPIRPVRLQLGRPQPDVSVPDTSGDCPWAWPLGTVVDGLAQSRHVHGCRLDVSTTSKLEPLTRPSVCSWSFDHRRLGAPLMYQSDPLSATIIP